MRRSDEARQRSSAALLLGCVSVLVMLIIVGHIVWAVATVPTTADAVRLSHQAIRDKALSETIAARPDACTIKGAPGFGWSVECRDIERTSGSECRSVWWNIDPWGVPSNGIGGRLDSLHDRCRKDF